MILHQFYNDLKSYTVHTLLRQCLPFIENLPNAQLIQYCSGNDRKIINDKMEKYRRDELHKFLV